VGTAALNVIGEPDQLTTDAETRGETSAGVIRAATALRIQPRLG
jgi:D-alanyl-D-alanine carboxypeptidase